MVALTRTALLTLLGTRALGMDVGIITNEPALGEEAVSDDPSIRYLPLPRFWDTHWGYTKAIPRELKKIKGVDIYHIRGYGCTRDMLPPDMPGSRDDLIWLLCMELSIRRLWHIRR